MEAISHLITIQVTQQVPDHEASSGIYCIFFIVPKRNKENLDLQNLLFKAHRHFKMEAFRSGDEYKSSHEPKSKG